jgi:hypothetical protein
LVDSRRQRLGWEQRLFDGFEPALGVFGDRTDVLLTMSEECGVVQANFSAFSSSTYMAQMNAPASAARLDGATPTEIEPKSHAVY